VAGRFSAEGIDRRLSSLWSFSGWPAAAAVAAAAASGSRWKSGCREGFSVLPLMSACQKELQLRPLQQIGTSIDGERVVDELPVVEETEEERRRMHEQHQPRWQARHTSSCEVEHHRRLTCDLYHRRVACPEGSPFDPGERV